jgi:hypothetical protein
LQDVFHLAVGGGEASYVERSFHPFAVESGATVEVTYGGGELCAEGEHRKTAVEMRCLPSASSNKEGASFLMGIIKEDCLLKLIVESSLACDMEGTARSL